MNLRVRLLKLEKRAVKPFKPVQVIFQQADESDEEGVNRAKVANSDGKSSVIVVKFVKSQSILII
jgi:hypothetical protein